VIFKDETREDDPKRRKLATNLSRVTYKKSEDLIYNAAEV